MGVRSKFSQIFTLDLRSLAAARIFIGVILCFDYIDRIRTAEVFYSDKGVLPREILLQSFLPKGAWTVYLFSGDLWYTYLLLGISMIGALFVLVGFRTKSSLLVSWVLLISVQNRNPLNLQAADILLKLLLFWFLFLPISTRLSVDSILNRIKHSSNSVHSLASVALTMQIASVFFFSGIFKLIPEWMSQSNSLYFTFSLTSFAKPIAQGFLSHPHTLSVVASLIVIFEIFVPLCIFFPIKRARICALLLMATFSCVLMVLMALGPFPVVILCGLVSLIPSEAYDLFGKGITSKNNTPPLDSKYSKHLEYTLQGFLLFCTLFVFVLNTYQAYSGRWPSGYFKLAAEVLALNQRWHMFSPVLREESHLIIEGVFSDGTALDMSTKRKVDWNFPKSPDQYHVTDRWHHYISTLSNATYQRLVLPLGRAMCVQGSYVDKNPIRFIKIFLIHKITKPPGTSPSVVRYNLGAAHCEKQK